MCDAPLLNVHIVLRIKCIDIFHAPVETGVSIDVVVACVRKVKVIASNSHVVKSIVVHEMVVMVMNSMARIHTSKAGFKLELAGALNAFDHPRAIEGIHLCMGDKVPDGE